MSKETVYCNAVLDEIFDKSIDVYFDIKKILKIYKDNVNDILLYFIEKITDTDKINDMELCLKIYNEIISRRLMSVVAEYYKSEKKIQKLISFICFLIEYNDNDFNINNTLSQILQKNFDDSEKEKITECIYSFYINSKKPRAKNIFLNELEIFKEATVLKSKPRIIDVTLTTKCNLNCIMCCNNYEKDFELSEEFHNYLIDNMKYFERILWKGGEVFLYKKYKELFYYAVKYNVNQTIITNLILPDKNDIEYIVDNDIQLSISIDAVDKKTYEKIRSGGLFDKLIENLEILKEKKRNKPKYNYSMNVVLISLNYKEISDIVDFALKYDFTHIHFLKCAETEKNRHLLLDREQLKWVYEALKSKEAELKKLNKKLFFEIDGAISLKFDNNNDKEEFKCRLPWKYFVYDSSVISFGCHCPKLNISDNIKNFWNSNELVAYRKRIINSTRNSCLLYDE